MFNEDSYVNRTPDSISVVFEAEQIIHRSNFYEEFEAVSEKLSINPSDLQDKGNKEKDQKVHHRHHQ